MGGARRSLLLPPASHRRKPAANRGESFTATIRSAARERLQRGALAIGLGVRLARTVDIAKIGKAAGFDWLFLDLEHGPVSVDVASQISVAALDTGIAPIQRVPRRRYTMAIRALDGGAPRM